MIEHCEDNAPVICNCCPHLWGWLGDSVCVCVEEGNDNERKNDHLSSPTVSGKCCRLVLYVSR